MVVIEVDPTAGQQQSHPRVSVGLTDYVFEDLEELWISVRGEAHGVELVDH